MAMHLLLLALLASTAPASTSPASSPSAGTASAPDGGVDAAKPPLEVSSVSDRAMSGQPGDTLLLVVGDRIVVARVDRTGILSHSVRLRLAGKQLHGKVGGVPVMLELGEHHIDGHIGPSAISLDVSRREAGVEVKGRFGAQGIAQSLSPTAVGAEIGPCRYALAFKGKEYVGQVECGGQPVPAQLRVPAALVARGDVELAALMTALFAR
jgi:hypothetical protein